MMHSVFAVEEFSVVYGEILDLLRLHWQEVASYQDLLELDPDVELYRALAERGKLLIVTARVAGKLVGYIVYIVGTHAHYRKVLQGVEDIHFLHPDYRRSRIGIALLKAGEAELRKRGVKLAVLRCKARDELDHSAIFMRLGYDEQDLVFTKRLD